MVAQKVRWSLLSALAGIVAGLGAAVFLRILELATDLRQAHPSIVWLLPLGGFAIGLLYESFGKEAAGGNNLVFEEIHEPKKVLPTRFAPLVMVSSIISHLFGASTGREGAVVQIGASLADQLSRFFQVDSAERKILLVAGAGAGFGSAIGVPWAGIIFGMEVIQVGRLRLFAWFECLIASFVAYGTCLLLGVGHQEYPRLNTVDWSLKTLIGVAAVGMLFGLVARAFSWCTHYFEQFLARHISYAPLRPLLIGALLAFAFWWEASYRYAGLGLPVIQEAFRLPASFADPIAKFFATALSVSSGFKGGEFVPIVFIGSTLGSALAGLFHLPLVLFSALGFAAVFAGASNTPVACTIMAAELFGWKIIPFALVVCFLSYYCSGHAGIYRKQKVFAPKHQRLGRSLLWFGELPRRWLR